MNFKLLYFFGSILVFIGLFWMLLPHVFHNIVSTELDEDAHEISHYLHLTEGLIPTLLGLTLMVKSENKLKPRKRK